VFEIVKAGGWVMVPIILCSIAALAIIGERLWSLQRKRICPSRLVPQIWQWVKDSQLDASHVAALRNDSPLGRILAAGLVNLRRDRVIMKEAIEDVGRQVVPELERYLNTLGTIAAISPLLGLLGTVTGIIRAFHAISGGEGMGSPALLAGGISEALITTAAGLVVAIPSLMFYRYFRGRVDELVVYMEQESLKMVEMLHGERDGEKEATPVARKKRA
jgi:biopolymer transport protein ExbB